VKNSINCFYYDTFQLFTQQQIYLEVSEKQVQAYLPRQN